MTLACATRAEAAVGRRAGLPIAVIGLGGVNGLPQEPVVSYGLAGALDGLTTATVIDAVRVVDEEGETLWEGEGLGVPGALRGTILGTDRVIDEPAERARLYERTGADAVDLESGVLARTGQMRGVLRVVSDTPKRRLHGICAAVSPEGRYDWGGMTKAFLRSPRGFAEAAADGKRALDALGAATARWVGR